MKKEEKMGKIYIPQPIDTNGVRLPEELDLLAEKIARNVHEVWSARRIRDGWTYGEERNDAERKHPCLVPYEELSEEEKAYDRNTSAETLKLIIKLGFKISAPDPIPPKPRESTGTPRVTPRLVQALHDDEIFVFGCRCSGRHDEGAAAFALKHFGAIYGQGSGRQGQAYAIATAGVDLTEIRDAVRKFLDYAQEHPELKFLVTAIGCGLGGWGVEDIAPFFAQATGMHNVWLPQEFLDYLQS